MKKLSFLLAATFLLAAITTSCAGNTTVKRPKLRPAATAGIAVKGRRQTMDDAQQGLRVDPIQHAE